MASPGPYTESDPFNNPHESGSFGFSEKSIRLGFIRKVYSILMCQLLVTVLFICLFLYVDAVRLYSIRNIWMFYTALVITLVCLIALACCMDLRRRWPVNFILLGVFTICESFLLGSAAGHYDKDEVLIAVGITTVVVLGLTLFAMQTKWDFTMCSGALMVTLLVLLCFGLLCIIFQSRILSIVYSSLAVLIFSMYLVFDTQMMLGGKHRYALSPEEYIFAALNLYLDVVNIFISLLTLIGAANN